MSHFLQTQVYLDFISIIFLVILHVFIKSNFLPFYIDNIFNDFKIPLFHNGITASNDKADH